jgi:hypothetical protein
MRCYFLLRRAAGPGEDKPTAPTGTLVFDYRCPSKGGAYAGWYSTHQLCLWEVVKEGHFGLQGGAGMPQPVQADPAAAIVSPSAMGLPLGPGGPGGSASTHHAPATAALSTGGGASGSGQGSPGALITGLILPAGKRPRVGDAQQGGAVVEQLVRVVQLLPGLKDVVACIWAVDSGHAQLDAFSTLLQRLVACRGGGLEGLLALLALQDEDPHGRGLGHIMAAPAWEMGGYVDTPPLPPGVAGPRRNTKPQAREGEAEVKCGLWRSLEGVVGDDGTRAVLAQVTPGL